MGECECAYTHTHKKKQKNYTELCSLVYKKSHQLPKLLKYGIYKFVTDILLILKQFNNSSGNSSAEKTAKLTNERIKLHNWCAVNHCDLQWIQGDEIYLKKKFFLTV